ncbi:hypothetical protein [Roseateles sp.]|jgi:hypothetical protein|uniref:hypothetical protein n=1 Tax=Roseateles sp. TaxID=1971397 RepID=UPI003BAA6C13
MGDRDIAGENLGVLQTYAKDSFKKLEKKCIASDGNERTTRKNMVQWMIDNGFAKEKAPGHGSGKPGDKMQDSTKKWIQSVQKKIGS